MDDPLAQVPQTAISERVRQETVEIFVITIDEPENETTPARGIFEGIEIHVGEAVTEVPEMNEHSRVTSGRVLDRGDTISSVSVPVSGKSDPRMNPVWLKVTSPHEFEVLPNTSDG
ncbi:hypothetical protein R4P64_30230 [Rhodococcus sp. IEGM 1366]|nr:hypothetical protein [Rhodococcus sp. IEGM 1366]